MVSLIDAIHSQPVWAGYHWVFHYRIDFNLKNDIKDAHCIIDVTGYRAIPLYMVVDAIMHSIGKFILVL